MSPARHLTIFRRILHPSDGRWLRWSSPPIFIQPQIALTQTKYFSLKYTCINTPVSIP